MTVSGRLVKLEKCAMPQPEKKVAREQLGRDLPGTTLEALVGNLQELHRWQGAYYMNWPAALREFRGLKKTPG